MLFIYKYVYVRLFFSVAYAPNTKFIEKPKQLTLIVRVISPNTRVHSLALRHSVMFGWKRATTQRNGKKALGKVEHVA